MSIENKREDNVKELNKELEDVSGGGLRERKKVTNKGFLGIGKKTKTYYDVTRDDTGEVVATFTNLTKANELDNYMNTNKRR